MANIKSAEKRARQTVGRQARNKVTRSKLRSAVKKHRLSEAQAEMIPQTHSQIDRAWKKGAIHKNAAARYKSRLAKAAGKKT
jgi:small subunit ribosomal protein S20